MIEPTRSVSYVGFAVLVAIGQAYLLLHSLVNSKPYKVVDPSNVFYYTAYVGVPVSFALCVALIYFIRLRIAGYLLPMVPALTFPIIVWTTYQLIFLVSGLDFFSGSGDFSVMQNEMAFAYDVVKVIMLACLGGLFTVGINVIITKLFAKSSTRSV